MAMQSGIGLSKILIIAGAGYTTTFLVRDGKLSDLIGHLQDLVRKVEKSGEQLEGDSGGSDSVVQQLKMLQAELQRHLNQPQIILNGASDQIGNYSSLIVPVATLGALGYGYMWWKGLKFSDLMYVTKRSMETAVANLTENLEQVSETISAAKKHLTQRIQLLYDKIDGQKEISRAIQNDVEAASENISQIGSELWQLQHLISGLDGKINTIEKKQDLANAGVLYLCRFINEKTLQKPKGLEALEDQFNHSGIAHRSLTYSKVSSAAGLKDLFRDDLSRSVSEPVTGVVPDVSCKLEDRPPILLAGLPRNILR
ncbi:hypothetical protein K2173_006345 [Erythroxylum novogranatense]|uniref:DUF1664 domain-containing protein n=1 Tax=Erythroxylum novogranatense TaxID=1862640 RepID=A0AAV8U385_9ROSI|nr:hypothetical protein K2173_006345 [Erythroxylum novogranatense]